VLGAVGGAQALESLLQVSVAGVTLENRCARVFLTDDGTLKSGCDITSPLTLFSNSSDPNEIRAAIESSLDVMQDIEDALNTTTRNAVFRTIVKSDIFGGFQPATGNDDATVTSVQTLALDFVLVNLERREGGDLVEDTARADFEIAASAAVRADSCGTRGLLPCMSSPFSVWRVLMGHCRQVRSLSSSTYFYAALFSGDIEAEADAAIDADVGLLAVNPGPQQMGGSEVAQGALCPHAVIGGAQPGYILLLAYSTYVLWRNNWVHSYSAMATISMACVGLAILGMVEAVHGCCWPWPSKLALTVCCRPTPALCPVGLCLPQWHHLHPHCASRLLLGPWPGGKPADAEAVAAHARPPCSLCTTAAGG
jgi:hypothetical protein